ncbi:Gfo/Idh/MocA family oxidoreductase [Psychroflexus tropicus]|uniref:Gfo/Idh/MocA family oxidoreductase n=1 Tax=Psychroflexus tropicus TaxID=197345 RepID=UPI0009FD2790|nr:Gfo/Idh/MocA family oxidoreductase [Psychroflexus tropicus]
MASRSEAKARAFAKDNDAHVYYDSYQALAKDPKVDIVYVATPHVFHAEHTLLCLKQNKAVLCEKPIAMNVFQFKTMQEAAKSNNCFLMEGLWTNFMPHLQKVHELIQQNTYGHCLKMEADFSFKAEFDPYKRLFNKNLGGGALLDIGIYPVYLALKLLGLPQDIEASCEYSSTGVDASNQIEFKYANGASAQLSSSFLKTTASQAKVYFEEAVVEFGSRFHETDKFTIKTDTGTQSFDYNYPANGYQFEIEHVHRCLHRGLVQSPEMSLEASYQLISTLDEIRHKMGLQYKEDKPYKE